MRRIAVVTTSRADFGIYRSTLRRMVQDPRLELQLIVAAAHLLPSMGSTVDEIAAELEIAAQLDVLEQPMTRPGVSRSTARMLTGVSEVLGSLESDVLVVLGDRFEMHAAALAALPLGVPVAHIHGGELTTGAFDDALRHSITKLSHLHFVSTERYAARVRQLGEEPWRITVCGAPSLDDIVERADRGVDRLVALGLSLQPPPIVVSYHAPTLEEGPLADKVDALLAALERCEGPIVFTAPNADPGGDELRARIEAFVARRDDAVLIPSMGADAYPALMSGAAVLVGNSSAGMIEAASLGLAVVNIGDRQAGRVRPANVIDVGHERDEILGAIGRAVSPGFREGLATVANPYDAGGAAAQIIERLATVDLGISLLQKHFEDLP